MRKSEPFRGLTLFSAAEVRHGCPVIAVGSLLACAGPFSVTVAVASGGTMIGRVGLIVTRGFVGLLCASQVGLQVSPKGLRHRFFDASWHCCGRRCPAVLTDIPSPWQCGA